MTDEHEQGIVDELSTNGEQGPGGNSTTESDRRRVAQNEVLIEALAAGRTYAEAGQEAGVSPRTIARRMADLEFARGVAARRAEHVSVITGQLAAMGTEAVDAIRAGFRAQRPADSLQAARLALSFGLRFRNESDVEARLADVERRLDDSGALGGPEASTD